jgi:hypothetical protein
VVSSGRVLYNRRVFGTVTYTALRELARARNGLFEEDAATRWFDGFWDWYVPNRGALEAARSLCVNGPAGGRCELFLVLVWEMNGLSRLDVFVEQKDQRPGQVAPWPVSTVRVSNGALDPPGSGIRPFNTKAACWLEERGWVVDVGHWGAHVHRAPAGEFDAQALGEVLDRTIALVDG